MAGRVRVERGHKRVRVQLGGTVIADTTSPLLVWEKPYYPTYYLPLSDIDPGVLVDSGETERSPSRGTATVYDVHANGVTAPAGAYAYPEPKIEELAEHVAFIWAAMDHWYEEDEEVYVHPRDPFSRVDILQSSRHIRVEIDGVVVADSHQPRLLFETGLPTRYYLPKTDVRMDLLSPTDLVTSCPYKGDAVYWTVDTGVARHEDVVWSYPFPVKESIEIAGYVCFYNEKVDIYVDGELEAKPKTHFA